MDIDNLNNSQLILLLLLLTLVVSAAVSVAALSLVYERLTVSTGDEQPTIIQQTINRIIEREVQPIVPDQTETVQVDSAPVAAPSVTLVDIEQSMVQVFHGSRPLTTGIFIDADGLLLASGTLNPKSRYNVLRNEQFVQFVAIRSDAQYSLLQPLEEGYVPLTYIPNIFTGDVSLGDPLLIFGGVGDHARLYRDIVSRRRPTSNTVEIFTNAATSDIALPSAVFINSQFAGFAWDYSGWVVLFNPALLAEPVPDVEA